MRARSDGGEEESGEQSSEAAASKKAARRRRRRRRRPRAGDGPEGRHAEGRPPKGGAPKAKAKKAAPVKLTDRQPDLLKKIHGDREAGYLADKKAEAKTLEALPDKKLIKQGREGQDERPRPLPRLEGGREAPRRSVERRAA